MQILGPDFVAQYLLRTINIHHSFLPFFPHLSGRNPIIKLSSAA
jgi:formyltetrahydrofolate hydrolase